MTAVSIKVHTIICIIHSYCVYTHTYIHIYTFPFTCIHKYTYNHIYIYTYFLIDTYTHTYVPHIRIHAYIGSSLRSRSLSSCGCITLHHSSIFSHFHVLHYILIQRLERCCSLRIQSSMFVKSGSLSSSTCIGTRMVLQ